ncbi:hypothetical protein M407DRAFT_33753 [Tulasnella calospora MUT 4182]|uniref:F-box domain-containing protein n=1 Tax=Tulasnella calospora MUT 4182 TaxID=1051891 RepID=A0A0C3Q2G4_9AGAM|nr:hypothetical protein M407DRAFT_33753 [Tulasnella calospora MUT 4182]
MRRARWCCELESPTITDVEVDLPGSEYAPVSSLTTIPELQRLSCRFLDIPYDRWVDLSWCKKLSELRLEETSSSGDVGHWRGRTVTFPVLRILVLDAREEIVTTMILNSRFPSLEHLSFGSRCLSADGMERVTAHLKEWSPHLRA